MDEEQPPEETDEHQNQSEAIEPEASDVDLNHVRGLMYALVTICVFCASILLGPDEQILPADGDLKIPIVNLTIKQGSFLYFGPIIIICVSMYTYLFLLKILAQVRAGRDYSDQYIFTMRNPAAQIATYGIFFWLPTLVLFAFAYKGLPRPESANLLGVALIFLISIVSIQVLLRLYQFNFLGIVAVSLICAVLVLFGFVGDEGWLEGVHEKLRTLRPMALDKADLEKRDLREVEISNAEAESITLRGAFLRDAVIRYSRLVGANLEGADLRNAKLECTVLKRANFDKANLEGAKVRNTNFESAKFRGAILKEANFYTAAARVSSGEDKACPKETSFHGANLERADLSRSSFIKVVFGETKFRGANLIKAKILGSSVTASDFREIFNQKTDLTRADLRCSRFNGSKMEGVILKKAELGGTNFSYANLTNADLTGAKFYRLNCSDPCIDLYINNKDCNGEDKIKAKLVGTILAFANLQGSILEGVDLTKADLRGANLRGAHLSEAILIDSNLMLTDLSSTTGLTCVQLRKAKYWRVSIRDLKCGQETLNFKNLIVDSQSRDRQVRVKARDDFRHVLEEFARSFREGRREKKRQISEATIKAAVRHFDKDTMKGAIMSGADLRILNLDDIVLEKAYLDGAILAGALFRRANLKGANLVRADLRKADLRGANLFGADMRNSKFQHAKLDGAILKGADLHSANLHDVIGLTCEQLKVAKNWEKSFRSSELGCGSSIPQKQKALQ